MIKAQYIATRPTFLAHFSLPLSFCSELQFLRESSLLSHRLPRSVREIPGILDMLNLVEFPTQPKCFAISLIPTSQPRPFALNFPQPHFSFHSNRLTHFNFCSFQWKSRTGFCSFASKNQGKGESGNFVLEMEDFDGADGFGEDEEDEGDEDDDEVFIPLRNMKEWLQNKPRGFGEGKVYDTKIEDELMEEIEQSRRAQLANINNLKNSPVNPGSMKKQLPQVEGKSVFTHSFV